MARILPHTAISVIIFLKTRRTPLHFIAQWVDPPAKMWETEGQPSFLPKGFKATSPYARREYYVIIYFGRYGSESYSGRYLF